MIAGLSSGSLRRRSSSSLSPSCQPLKRRRFGATSRAPGWMGKRLK